jgi:hypothetical protein
MSSAKKQAKNSPKASKPNKKPNDAYDKSNTSNTTLNDNYTMSATDILDFTCTTITLIDHVPQPILLYRYMPM